MANGKRNGSVDTPAPQRPVHEVRIGHVKAAIWKNDGEHGVRYGVTVCRVYKDRQEKWQTTDSFGRDDLLVLAKVLDRAHTWILDAPDSPSIPF